MFFFKKKEHKKNTHTHLTTSTSTATSTIMDINDADEIVIFYADNVTFQRIGNSGEETYEPGYVTIRTDKRRDWKGWVIARNHAGNVLIFNAMIPGGVPIVGYENTLSVRFGKVPSLSYVNDEGKPIPTLWKATFRSTREFQQFFGLMKVFAHLADVVNKNAPPAPLRNPSMALPLMLPVPSTPSASR